MDIIKIIGNQFQLNTKNTSYVKCLKCGSDNLLGEKYGTCEYCRGMLVNKNYKG